MRRKRIKFLGLGTIQVVVFLLTAAVPGAQHQAGPNTRNRGPRYRTTALPDRHLLIGYWHNFINKAGFLPLGQVSPQFDVINVAFAVPAAGSTSVITFDLDPHETESQFIADIATLHAEGKLVVLSIGGADATVRLNTDSDVQSFVASVSSIVNQFGFDGIDIDFENDSVILDDGDLDFKNPTTPATLNLISALYQLKSQFGPNFVISMAPETFGVQMGFADYGGGAGAYLPIIYGTRGILSYVHVQDYNTGKMFGLDGLVYAQGTADFQVAMTDMLLQGFPVGGDQSNVFPPLSPNQVAFGVPASPRAAGGGFATNTDLLNALKYLIQGVPFGGRYVLQNPAGYPGLRGLMTFSIDWDAAASFSLSNSIGPYLHFLGQSPVITDASADRKNLVVTGSGFDGGAVITVDGQDQRTLYPAIDPTTELIGKKLLKRAGIAPGDTVMIQVRNFSGALSNQFPYTRSN